MFKIGDKVKLSKLHLYYEEYKKKYWIVGGFLNGEVILVNPISGSKGTGIDERFLELVKEKSHLPKWW